MSIAPNFFFIGLHYSPIIGKEKYGIKTYKKEI